MQSIKPAAFKWRHFSGDLILQCVRWYCKYGISYRDLEEMLAERGLSVDHTTIYRWIQHYAPELRKRVAWYQKSFSRHWYLDETYIKVRGEWKYLYRAIDENGETLDFYLSHRRNAKAATRFIKKLIKRHKDSFPTVINTDKNPAYLQAIRHLKQDNSLPEHTKHKRIKYNNNQLESDHGKLKRLIKRVSGFQSMKTALATLKGFEVMRMFKKGQFQCWIYGRRNEVSFINELFEIYS